MTSLGDHVNGLPKRERMSGKKDIEALVSTGRWGSIGHIKYCYRANGCPLNRVLVSVPKKFFKRAVRRNLLKRRLREAYRKQKTILPPAGELGGTDLLLQYNSPEIAEYTLILDEVAAALTAVASKTQAG